MTIIVYDMDTFQPDRSFRPLDIHIFYARKRDTWAAWRCYEAFRSNRKNEYFRRRVLKREYLIFPRGRETRTRAIGAICFKNWSSRAAAIDILEEDSRDKWTLRRNRIEYISRSFPRLDIPNTENFILSFIYLSLRSDIAFVFSSYGEKIGRAIPARVRIPLCSYESSWTGLGWTWKRSKGR